MRRARREGDELAGEVVAVEKHRGPRARAAGELRRLGAANVTVVNADALELPPELTGFDRALVDAPCSGLGVLARRPDLRWRARPLPELQLALLHAAAERVRPGRDDHLLGLHAERRRERGGRRGERSRAGRGARRGVAATSATRAARSSCSRCRTCTAPPGSSSPGCGADLGSGHALGGRVRESRGRAVALRGRLRAARASSSKRCSTRACSVFHFDVGDGHFVEPITIGPIVLRGDRRPRARARGACSTAT